MSLSKKHFNYAAYWTSQAKPNSDQSTPEFWQWKQSINLLVDLFSKSNPLFKCSQFREACENPAYWDNKKTPSL